MEALAVHALLHGHANVRLWSPTAPHPSYSSHPIETILEKEGHYPRGGSLVLVGGYYSLGGWLAAAAPEHIILKYNSFTHRHFFSWLEELEAAGLPQPRLVFPSKLLKDAVSLEGLVEPSPIDIDLFHPAPRRNDRFTIGRLSRDTLGKHHEDDPSLYRMLAFRGCRIRIMGGACLGEYLQADATEIELLPVGAQPAENFLQSLDCFFYRTGEFLETFGRVVLEAMATGLPVVCHRRGGYAEWIRDGDNGFLFDTQEEAYEKLAALQGDRSTSERIGDAARETAVALFGEKAVETRRNWYLSS